LAIIEHNGGLEPTNTALSNPKLCAATTYSVLYSMLLFSKTRR